MFIITYDNEIIKLHARNPSLLQLQLQNMIKPHANKYLHSMHLPITQRIGTTMPCNVSEYAHSMLDFFTFFFFF
jgi:hypothetical protein